MIPSRHGFAHALRRAQILTPAIGQYHVLMVSIYLPRMDVSQSWWGAELRSLLQTRSLD